ncbi:MAG: TonB-dependent receptor [Puniceicoccaceae bacterium]|nr:MAG: TonB-dependent receptor [Puniceicoccaceae bacterium]
MPAYVVIGSRAAVDLLPGSGSFLDLDDITAQGYDDINQVMRRIPGVYTRQEDGFGLFPNISIRGVSTTRNSKISVMEDGILSSPAPYANPAAYYTPTTGRMAGIEVLKGSSQIRFGPQTTGGIINYLSTPIPLRQSGRALIQYGSDRDARAHVWYGDRHQTEAGTVAWLVEHYYRSTDGFKTIDGTAAFPGSDQTGFRKQEPMGKLRFEPAALPGHAFEIKIGYTDLVADETYLGLTEADFRANPTRRYASSRFDRIDTRQTRTYLRHHFDPSPDFSLTSTLYYNKFSRSWYKLHDARVVGGSFRSLSEILAGQHGQGAIDILRGEAAGDLRLRNNNRNYRASGAEVNLRRTFETGDLSHRLEMGVRLHEDYEDRFQNDDVYRQNSLGGIDSITRGMPGTQDNRRGTARALAFFVEDRIGFGDLDVIPGLRYERIRYTNVRRNTTPGPDFNTTLPGFPQRRTIDYFAPGIGFNYRPEGNLGWFGGVYRGVAVPGPGDATGGAQLREETSLSFEAGLRFRGDDGITTEVVFFHTRFDDLIVPDNIGGGGGGITENAGRVNSTGLEVSFAADPGRASGWAVGTPVYSALTLTRARLASDVEAAGAGGAAVESIFSGGRKGNKIPNIPDWQLQVGGGLEGERWRLIADAFYFPGAYGTANNTRNLRRGRDADGELDSRFGRLDRYFVVDLSLHYRLTENASLRGTVENLFDWEYVSSRIPHGPRPGRPRSFSAGVELTF